MSKPIPSALECARLYLAPPPGAFWQWSADHSAVEWHDGTSILLREEVLALIESRTAAERGAPRFQMVVLLAAALRTPQQLATILNAEHAGLQPDLQHVWSRLRHRPTARATLYDWVLGTTRDNKRLFSSRVHQALSTPLPAGHLQTRQYRALPPIDGLRTIAFGLRGLTTTRVETLARIGIPDLPGPQELDEPDASSAADLLASITEDEDELAGVATAAREAMAAFRVPHLTAEPQQLAQGGVAGLSNRGSLDRLALSELAHDDYVLAVRIASNEALFIEHERPPATPRYQRRLLLDCGVRMWGQPRVLAAAIALAFSATQPDRHARVAIATWSNGAMRHVDLSTREGLLSQLELLDHTLDIGGALPAFLDDVEQHGDEAILIVHRDTLADPEFRAQLRACSARLFVIDVEALGRARLWQARARGLLLQREATLTTHGLGRRTARRLTYYEQLPEPLPPRAKRGGSTPTVRAIAYGNGMIGVRSRRGRQLLMWLSSSGRVGLDARAMDGIDQAPLFPHVDDDNSRQLLCAELGSRLDAFWDGRLLHLLARDTTDELTIDLDNHTDIRGYDGTTQAVISGEQLITRVAELVGSEPATRSKP